MIISLVKLNRCFHCLTAWFAAIPPELNILVLFLWLQSFETCKLASPKFISPEVQSSQCFLEKLDVYWQQSLLHKAQPALGESASGREAELLLLSNNLEIYTIYPGSWSSRLYSSSAKGSSSSDLQDPTGALGGNILLSVCQNWCGWNTLSQRGRNRVNHKRVIFVLVCGKHRLLAAQHSKDLKEC